MSKEEQQKSSSNSWAEKLEERLTQITQRKAQYNSYKAGRVRVDNHKH